MSGLPTIKTRIVALAFFAYRDGHDILDLSSGLVHVLLPIGLVLNLSLLPGMSLLHWLSILLRLEFALVIIISGPVVVHELVFSFCDEGFVYHNLEIRKVEHTKSAFEVLIQSSKKSVDLPFFRGHIIERISGQMVELMQVLTY